MFGNRVQASTSRAVKEPNENLVARVRARRSTVAPARMSPDCKDGCRGQVVLRGFPMADMLAGRFLLAREWWRM